MYGLLHSGGRLQLGDIVLARPAFSAVPRCKMRQLPIVRSKGGRRCGTSDAGYLREEVTGVETSACSQHDGDHGHIHAEETCGHESFRHGDHFDFEREGHWHAKHGDHWDEHPRNRG